MAAIARTVIPLDDGWRFFQGGAEGAESPGFDDSSWRKLDIPHDWSIEGSFDKNAATGGAGGWLPSGVAWYRRKIELPPTAAGRRVWVEFDGVMANSDVWLNGRHLGHRPNGYVGFRHDVTDHVRPGAVNLLAVKADTSAQPASRWYTGAGIYRQARLVMAEPVHIAPWGVFVTTPVVSSRKAIVNVATRISNTTAKAETLTLRSVLLDGNGKRIAMAESGIDAPAAGSVDVPQLLLVSKPALWSVESPDLHTLVSSVIASGRVTDESRTSLGIRNAEFRPESGFWLNGKNLKLKGVCLHHDGGAVGAAVPLDVWQRRLAILRDLGVNAIRTAHNPPAPEFLDLCDRMGFLVMDEFFDCWTKAKNPHDYHRHFKKWSHTDLHDGVLRDRNHPSVILYSVGNEIHDTGKPDLAKGILRGLVDVCHAADPTRPVTQALFRPNSTGDYQNGLADMLDVIGTNYRDQELLEAWKAKPGRKIIGTEQSHERSTWLACRDNPPHAGQFLWVGVDYLGESRSWPLTVFNSGLIDRAGFIQPRGYERQSWWSDKPMVKALRRVARTAETPADPGYEAVEWKRQQVLFADWNPAQAAPEQVNVEIYSNAGEVELLLNGQSLGKKPTRKDCAPLNWNVPFAPGTLEAIARIDGEVVARDTLRTAGKAVAVRLLPDKKSLGTRWDDVAHVVVELIDANGTVVPDATDPVHFELSGPGKIVAVDSGSVVSTELFQATKRMAFQGRCLAIVRATSAGELTLRARVDGMEPASIRLPAADLARIFVAKRPIWAHIFPETSQNKVTN